MSLKSDTTFTTTVASSTKQAQQQRLYNTLTKLYVGITATSSLVLHALQLTLVSSSHNYILTSCGRCHYGCLTSTKAMLLQCLKLDLYQLDLQQPIGASRPSTAQIKQDQNLKNLQLMSLHMPTRARQLQFWQSVFLSAHFTECTLVISVTLHVLY